jgi:hypothetical protein
MVFTAKSKTESELEVADGQQRLATVLILLAAFRDYLYLDPSQRGYVAHLQEQYLAPYDPHKDGPRPVLTLNTEDNAFFERRIILTPDDPERLNETDATRVSHERIDTAARIAKRWVEKITNTQDQAQKITNIKSWVDYLRESARVILVIVPDPGKAFKIFETLNDRGLRLSQVDLLKNHLYALAETGKRFDDVRKPWDEMVGALESSGYEELELDYIRQMWISYHGYIKEAELYDAIKDYAKSPSGAVKFAGDLSKNVIPYMALLNPSHPLWKDRSQQTAGAERCIDVMVNSLRVDRIRPLLLSIVAKFNRKGTELAFRLCISWTVRFLIVGGIGSGTVEQFYAMTAKKMRDGDIPDPQALAAEMKKHVPTNKEFKESFAGASVARGPLARYYLRCLELQQRGERNASLATDDNPEQIDLEHVIPKKPSQHWNLPEDERKVLVNKIGNQVLLEKKCNSTLKGDGFDNKRVAYDKSSQALTRLLAKERTWGAEEISERQKYLAELAVKTWPITVQEMNRVAS